MRDVMLDDLADSHLMAEGSDMLIIYDLSEHHLRSYINALRISHYYPTWIQAYTWDGVSNFVVISKKATTLFDHMYRLEMDASKKRLYNHVADLEEQGYHIMMAQSYTSFSHDKRAQHWVLMAPGPDYQQNVLWNVAIPLKVNIQTFTNVHRANVIPLQNGILLHLRCRELCNGFLLKAQEWAVQGRWVCAI